MKLLSKNRANTNRISRIRRYFPGPKHIIALTMAMILLDFILAQTHYVVSSVPKTGFTGWMAFGLLGLSLGRMLWMERVHKSRQAALSQEKALITFEKEEQQRFYANLIHEVIKGEAQCLLTKVGSNIPIREHLTEFVKTCELSQSFVDQHSNDLHDLMTSMEFIFSNRLHSEMEERYFFCKIDPALRGIRIHCQQKYELIFFLRECLNNIRKYAEYRHVCLHIFCEKNRVLPASRPAVILEIKDDGLGLSQTLNLAESDFEINAANLPQFYAQYLQQRRCTGIQEIFNKAARMNGKLTIRPNENQGTAIHLRFFPN